MTFIYTILCKPFMFTYPYRKDLGISTVLVSYASPIGPLSTSVEDNFQIAPLDVFSTCNLLKRIKPNTATGPDDIPAFLIRKLAQFISPNIAQLYNSSISNGIFPLEWKKANVVAIYKGKGSKADVENYRPISVLPVLGRVLEKAVCSQLQQYCNAHEIIPNQQFGFRKNSSCELALLAALDSWMGDVAQGRFVGALMVDLSKAFDSISHIQLIHELESIGCCQLTSKWFSSLLAYRQQRVKVGANSASWKPVSKRVPQGSPLSPLLFNIMIRHLPLASEAESFQFADDLTNSVCDNDLQGLASRLLATYKKSRIFAMKETLRSTLPKF